MTEPVLTDRELGRATLARQLLLERSSMASIDAIEQVAGLQSQLPHDPYVALWSRLVDLDPDALGQLLVDRAVVRIVLMRGTIHLVSAADCLMMRGPLQPVLSRQLLSNAEHKAGIAGLDLDVVLDAARRLLGDGALTGPELQAALTDELPGIDAGAAAVACRNHLALVQVPPRGVWSRAGQVRLTTAEAWLGRPIDPAATVAELLRRYLAGFGPASVADMSTWSGLTGLREVVERLGTELRTFRDERGRELFDLPDAARPPGDTPAPPRFLPMFDNLLLSHADRTRCLSDTARQQIWSDRAVPPTVLIDGEVGATWKLVSDRRSRSTRLDIELLETVPKRSHGALEREGRELLRFLEPAMELHDVRVLAAAT